MRLLHFYFCIISQINAALTQCLRSALVSTYMNIVYRLDIYYKTFTLFINHKPCS